MPYNGSHLPSVQPVDKEREKELCQQLKQANDTAARLQDELRQSEDRVRRLQQLDERKDDVSQPEKKKKKKSDDGE